MPIDASVAAVLEEQNLTNNKALAVDAPILRGLEGHDKTLRQADASWQALQSERAQIFGQRQAQADALFMQWMRHIEDEHALTMRVAHEHVTIAGKGLDAGAAETNEAAIGAKVVADISPVLTKAMDTAAVRGVNNGVTIDGAALSAIIAAVTKNVNNTESVDLAALAKIIDSIVNKPAG